MNPTSRADVALVRAGLARSRAHAAELIRAGRVTDGGRPVTKPAQLVDVPDPDREPSAAPRPSTTSLASAELASDPGDQFASSSATSLRVQPDASDHDYASRGAFKLLGALEDLDGIVVQVEGRHCVDLGASTGGFTDVLLRHGAASVTAIDVGHGQMVDRLRTDPRVTVVEGFNVRDLTPADLIHSPALIVGDLSFISLRLVLPAIASVMKVGSQALLLVKPQFEVGKERLGAGGVVRDEALRREAVEEVKAAGRQLGLAVRAETPSKMPGASGNQEFFVVFEREPIRARADVEDTPAQAAPAEPAPGGTP